MNHNNCLKNTLKYIYFIQNNNYRINYYNTRIITLYDKYNNLFKGTYLYNNKEYNTSLLRIEKVYEDYAVFSLIHQCNNKYINTYNYICININCICAIKCLQDIKLIYERRF